MIRHRNYYAMVQKSDEMEDRLLEPGDVMLLYLPLAHNYGRLLHLSAAYHGFTIAFLPDPLRAGGRAAARAADDLPERPARLREDSRRGRSPGFDERTGVQRRIVDWALDVGRRVSRLRQAKQPVPRAARAQHRLADRLVYSKVKEKLGGRLRVANAGGAPLSRDIAEFFHAIDILVLEGYGLSEVTTAATVNRPSDFKFGTVGKPLPGVELRHRRRRRDPHPLEHRLRRLLPRRRGDARDDRRRGLRAHRRRRPHRRGRVPRHHRPQEGHHRHGRREERRAAEPRERAEGAQGDLAGARRRRPQAVHRRTRHARRGGDERHVGRRGAQRGAGGGRRRERRPLTLRADQAVHDPAARVLARPRRGDADAEAQAQGDPRPLRRSESGDGAATD